jgi:sulfur-oxidizing protein SoxZ
MGSMPIRIRARAVQGHTDVTLLMPHPMETGMRKDDSGSFVPAHFITDVEVVAEGRVVLQARLSQAVSQDPLLSFRYRGGAAGDALQVRWTDSRGAQRSDSVLVSA